MTTYAFLYKPRSPHPPFQPLPVPMEVGYSTDDAIVPGDFLGTIQKGKDGLYAYSQRCVSFRVRLSPKHLKDIARRVEQMNEESLKESKVGKAGKH